MMFITRCGVFLSFLSFRKLLEVIRVAERRGDPEQACRQGAGRKSGSGRPERQWCLLLC